MVLLRPVRTSCGSRVGSPSAVVCVSRCALSSLGMAVVHRFGMASHVGPCRCLSRRGSLGMSLKARVVESGLGSPALEGHVQSYALRRAESRQSCRPMPCVSRQGPFALAVRAGPVDAVSVLVRLGLAVQSGRGRRRLVGARQSGLGQIRAGKSGRVGFGQSCIVEARTATAGQGWSRQS